MNYSFTIENLRENYAEFAPLYKQHYAEMQENLAARGIAIPAYAPRTDAYFASADKGHLIHYVVRCDGEAVGYSNVYLSNDMHNGDDIAVEDTVFVTKAHRNGVGKVLIKNVLEDLKARGVRRFMVSPTTDPRVGKLWTRMGFVPVAQQMAFIF